MPRFGDMNSGISASNRTVSRVHSACQQFGWLCLLLMHPSLQNVSWVLDWRGRWFHPWARPQMAVWLLQHASQRCKGHDHGLVAALLHGAMSTAGAGMAAVLRDGDLVAASRAEAEAAPEAFGAVARRDAVAASAQVEALDISEDRMMGLCHQMFTISDRLKNIVDDECLAQVTESSLTATQGHHRIAAGGCSVGLNLV